MEAPLDRADEGHIAAKGDGLVRSADRLIDVGRGSIMRVTRLREHIEHRPEVGVDRLLEGDDLRVRDVHVASLRRKLGDPGWIQTVRGVGFRLRPPA